MEAENKVRVRKADLAVVSNKAEARAKVAGEIMRAEEELLEGKRIELNRQTVKPILFGNTKCRMGVR